MQKKVCKKMYAEEKKRYAKNGMQRYVKILKSMKKNFILVNLNCVSSIGLILATVFLNCIFVGATIHKRVFLWVKNSRSECAISKSRHLVACWRE
jgi:hypothetical protein